MGSATTRAGRHTRMPQRAAVLGSPIGHSRSPTLYRAGFAALGMTGWSFDALECDADALSRLLAESDDEWAGFAVTMPGKHAAAEVADERSDRVETLGVANTLIRTPTGWRAENTDVDGVRGALVSAPVTPSGPVLLLGGGGTARAVIAALAELDWDGPVTLAGRREASTAEATALARDLGLDAHATLSDPDEIGRLAPGLSLAISTFPAGGADALATTLAHVPALLDVIYDPWPTRLVAAGAAGAADRVTMTGLDMLLHQALTQFELITGRAAPAESMRDALLAAVGSGAGVRLGP